MNPWLIFPSVLAATDTPAYRAGYVMGMIIAGLVMLGIAVFAVIAIIMALTRRTKGWVITGSIAGVGVAAFTVFFFVAFVFGVVKGVQEGKPGLGANAPAQTITGTLLPFTLELPAGWEVKRGQGDFDFVGARGSKFVGVLAEEADLGDPAKIAEIARERIQSLGSDVEMSEPAPLMLDGRGWSQFTVKCKVKLIPFAYQYYVYLGKEGTFQIMGWTFQNLWAREEDGLREVMKTFRFPPAAASTEQ